MKEKSLNEKVLELGLEVKRLRAKVSKTKGLSVTKYKGLGTYKSDLKATAGLLLVKERIKLRRLLRKLHYIEDMSILEKLDEEFIFSEGDGAKERGEEVTQKDPHGS